MRKMLAVCLAVLTVLSVSMLFVSADETDRADVYVTIADRDGKLAVAYEPVTVTDIDGDGALTVNDTLYAAHERFYDGGAEAGFATEQTQWGLSLKKLWGTENGGSYGYMVNDQMAYSMTDPVKADDYVAAYVFTDPKDLADKYSFFDKKVFDEVGAPTVELTLSKNDFDEDWNSIVLPVVNAELIVNGKFTGIYTDAEGKASYTFDKNGDYLISAFVRDQVIVPPVCKATIKAYAETATPDQFATPDQPTENPAGIADADDDKEPDTVVTDDPATDDEADKKATDDEATGDQATKDEAAADSAASGTPATNDVTNIILWVVITLVCLAGIIGGIVFYKKRYGKK